MRKLLLLSVGLFFLFSTNNSVATTIWADNVNQTNGWSDADKNWDDDTLLCWAATASNILSWSGWNTGYANEDAIFTFLQDEDPIDAVGWMSYAWSFWFDGTQQGTGDHFDGSTHNGYYTTAQYTAAYYEDMTGGSDVLSQIANYLILDYGIGVAVRGDMSHAITLWGLEKNDNDDFIGVWVTDSDDASQGQNPLRYYDVNLSGGNWYLKDFYGRNTNYIDEFQALRVSSVIPEPSAMILFGLGLLGVAGIGRKRKSKSILISM